AERLAVELGRPDLRMRARLVRAEVLIRQGDTTASGRIAHEAVTWATEHGDAYVLARSHLAVSGFRRYIGDQSDALAHAVQCLAHTRDDVPAAIRARHLTQLAVTLCESGSLDDAFLRLTTSIGVATVEAGHITASALLARADRNLYAAKRIGRNR